MDSFCKKVKELYFKNLFSINENTTLFGIGIEQNSFESLQNILSHSNWR